MHLVRHVNGGVIWANTHRLFWLSLIPFATGWMGENHFTQLPAAVYGVALLMPAIAYYVLQLTIIRAQGPGSPLAWALGRDVKGKASLALYVAAIGLAFVHPWIACGIYLLVALLWFIPDRRIERGVNPD